MNNVKFAWMMHSIQNVGVIGFLSMVAAKTRKPWLMVLAPMLMTRLTSNDDVNPEDSGLSIKLSKSHQEPEKGTVEGDEK